MTRINPKTTPIYQTSVFTFQDLNELEAYFETPGQAYMYTRYGNPNTDELAQAVNEWEEGAGAVVTSSGMAAILAAVLTYCQAGDHVLCSEEIYGGASTLLSQECTRLGMEITYVPMDSLYQLEKVVQPNTKLLLTETITNPLLRVQDIKRLSEECQRLGLKVVIDNTFATPVITKPLTLGADLVVHSVTKYLSGHSDVTAGVVIAKEQGDAERLQQIVRNYGINLSPFESWLAARGLQTLQLRVDQHCRNALHIAEQLEKHPQVKKVYYPGLPSHLDHQLAKEQGKQLYGGMLSFTLEDSIDVVNRWMRSLQHIVFAPSLAGVKTSISHPLSTSHRSITQELQTKLGITEGLIRLSVGIEQPELLKDDLIGALNKL